MKMLPVHRQVRSESKQGRHSDWRFKGYLLHLGILNERPGRESQSHREVKQSYHRVAERSSRIRNIAQYYMQGRIGSDAGPSFW